MYWHYWKNWSKTKTTQTFALHLNSINIHKLLHECTCKITKWLMLEETSEGHLAQPPCFSREIAKNDCILQSKHVICKKVSKIYTFWNNLINTVFLNISYQMNCLCIDHFGYTWTIRISHHYFWGFRLCFFEHNLCLVH